MKICDKRGDDSVNSLNVIVTGYVNVPAVFLPD